jgi:type I restriction enzyme, R subunit
MNDTYDILSENNQSTVVNRYERPTVVRETFYQSEADLERHLIAQLREQGYEYVPIKCEAQLIDNLRRQLERLNGYAFSDNEWQRFFKEEIAKEGSGIADKAFTIQQDEVKTLTRDNGEIKNIRLIDRKDIHHNATQVINQYEEERGAHPNRYDVTILVNGLPLVHIELKRRGVALREAFNQINRYGRDSFWAGSGLFDYVQIFVISNGTATKYYSNTTRNSHIREQAKTSKKPRQKTCNSYEFTSYWSDGQNKVLGDLDDFAATFFSRHTLLNVLTKYCVLTEQKILMAMRPYQIAATEKLLNQIEIAHNNRRWGTTDAGGFIWHTTGSGKTLTSFKAAQLATKLDYIDKVLFVVDRKDLDYQTMREYDRFQKGAANGNTSTRILQRQIEDSRSNMKIIITTIQKLAQFVKKHPQHEFYNKEVVLIFDECHRSQFGEMHAAITKSFKKYYLFGFTGTPIFRENIASTAGTHRMTADVFGRRLHAYTIVDAIRDRNVLPFRVDYISTIKEKEGVEDKQVRDIEREKALADPRRIHNVAQYIVEHFDQQTKRGSAYTFNRLVNIEETVISKSKEVAEIRQKARLNGFNSIFAVQSIDFAKLYYTELQKLNLALPENRRLRIATIFSYAANEELDDTGDMEESNDDTNGLDQSSRDFLDMAIADYNRMFNTSYDTSADKFPNYYKDVSQRMKNREIDLLIVVNMFLTGFDATTLNTLWVDKNLRYHGLLQAYSRTNRILNSVKTFGNIVCFRNLEDATNRCLALFGDRDARGVTILRPFDDYMNGFIDGNGKRVMGYREMIEKLRNMLAPDATPTGEKAEKEFIRLFGAILKMRNLLACFDQFNEEDCISERDIQDYTSTYIDLAENYRKQKGGDKENINDDVEFEMELVKQVEVNIDYILFLVQEYNESHKKDTELMVKIRKAIDASPNMRDKKQLIEHFIQSLTPGREVYDDWKEYVNEQKREEYDEIIRSENLREKAAKEFIMTSFRRGYVPEGGLELNDIMPPINPFDPTADCEGKLIKVLEKIKAFFNKFFDVANGDF